MKVRNRIEYCSVLHHFFFCIKLQLDLAYDQKMPPALKYIKTNEITGAYE